MVAGVGYLMLHTSMYLRFNGGQWLSSPLRRVSHRAGTVMSRHVMSRQQKGSKSPRTGRVWVACGGRLPCANANPGGRAVLNSTLAVHYSTVLCYTLLCSTILCFRILCSTILCSALLYSCLTLLCSTLLYSALLLSSPPLYSALLCSTLLYSTLLYSALLLCSTLLHSALLHSALLCSTTLLCSDLIDLI